MDNKKWIGIDLDGTLAVGIVDPKPSEIGEAIPPMLDYVKRLIAEGRWVKIFTARVSQPKSIPYVKKWLVKNGIGGLEITNVKDWDCMLIFDDKAIQVVRNSGLIIGYAPPTFLEIVEANDEH